MTPESKVKAAVKKVAKGYSNVLYFMPITSGIGGVHDFIFCVAGNFFTVECKADDGSVTPLQAKFAMDVITAGGKALCCKGLKDVPVVESYIQMLGGVHK